jgi:hypothetical protein
VFIIVVGEAQFIAGGTIADAWVTAPGQTRGSGMVSHHLTKGGVITIPARPDTVEGDFENRLSELLRG